MSIVRDHPELRNELNKRWTDLKKGNRDIVKDSAEAGFKVNETAVSRYRKYDGNGQLKGGLSEEQVIKLATLYGVFVSVNVGIATVIQGKPSYRIVSYDKEKCNRIFQTIYGQK